jgi:hypothetical protein
MRAEQFAGLAPIALEFLRAHQCPPRTCSTCGHATTVCVEETVSSYRTGWGDKDNLNRHYLKDGEFADEFLQVIEWSSGPIYFLGLRLQNGTELTWMPEDIEEWL